MPICRPITAICIALFGTASCVAHSKTMAYVDPGQTNRQKLLDPRVIPSSGVLVEVESHEADEGCATNALELGGVKLTTEQIEQEEEDEDQLYIAAEEHEKELKKWDVFDPAALLAKKEDEEETHVATVALQEELLCPDDTGKSTKHPGLEEPPTNKKPSKPVKEEEEDTNKKPVKEGTGAQEEEGTGAQEDDTEEDANTASEVDATPVVKVAKQKKPKTPTTAAATVATDKSKAGDDKAWWWWFKSIAIGAGIIVVGVGGIGAMVLTKPAETHAPMRKEAAPAAPQPTVDPSMAIMNDPSQAPQMPQGGFTGGQPGWNQGYQQQQAGDGDFGLHAGQQMGDFGMAPASQFVEHCRMCGDSGTDMTSGRPCNTCAHGALKAQQLAMSGFQPAAHSNAPVYSPQ